MTPIELVLGAKDETDATVIKIIRFLQSIDDDGNLPNGIKISQAIRDIAAGKTINFLESELEFENEGFFTEIEIEAGTERGHPLLTAAEAQAHFKATLLRSLAGTYSGTFSGDDGGTWTFTLDDAGKFTAGSGNSNEDGAFTILNSGASATSNGAFVLGGSTSNGATFTGNITRSGEVSGTWQNNAFAEKGTFSGSKTAATVTAQGEAGGLTPIGSNTCSGGTFGCLTLSGTELGQDGTVLNVGGHLFIISPTTGKPLVLNWFEGIDGVGGRGLVVGFDGNGNIEGVGFVRTSVTTTSPSTIDKGYDCNVPSCSGLSHDPVAKTVTFNNLVLQPGTTPGNATATLTLNGTLSY